VIRRTAKLIVIFEIKERNSIVFVYENHEKVFTDIILTKDISYQSQPVLNLRRFIVRRQSKIKLVSTTRKEKDNLLYS
jgi:hypothetical protein